MIRTISSSLTFICKFIFPSLWIFVLVGLLFEMLFTEAHSSWLERLGFLLACVWGGLTSWSASAHLKRIRLDDEALYISNYAEEIRVPLSELLDISEDRYLSLNGRPIKLTFKSKTSFGSSVEFLAKYLFIPKIRFYQSIPHPVIAEIQAAIEQAKRNDRL